METLFFTLLTIKSPGQAEQTRTQAPVLALETPAIFSSGPPLARRCGAVPTLVVNTDTYFKEMYLKAMLIQRTCLCTTIWTRAVSKQEHFQCKFLLHCFKQDSDWLNNIEEPIRMLLDYTNENLLYGGQGLSLGDSISINGVALRLDTSGDLHLIHISIMVYHTNTANSGVVLALMQNDGNFVLYDSSWKPIWSTGTHGNPGSKLVLQSDCTYMILNDKGRPIYKLTKSCP